MSYARFHDGSEGPRSDIYLYLHCDGHFACQWCALESDPFGVEDFRCDTTYEAIDHVLEHIAAGHAVPNFTIPGLRAEAVDNDKFIRTGSW